MCELTCVLPVLETSTQRIEQVQFLLERWSYPSDCFLQQALSFHQCRATDWPIDLHEMSLTSDFKKETLLKVYPGIDRIPSLKMIVGTDIGGLDIDVEVNYNKYCTCHGIFRYTWSQRLVNMLGRFLLIAIQL